MKRTLALLTILAATAALTGCFQSRHSLVRLCSPTKKLLREANTKYADHTPLTADALRHMLKDDTTHYKLVVVYSYCCGPCHERMNDTYLPMLQDLDTQLCRMIFVLDDCGSLPWNADYLNQFGINTRYYLRDDDSLFLEWERGGTINRMTNIANYALMPKRAFTNCNYVPLNFIVSPDGRVKQECQQFDDVTFITSYDLHSMLHRDSLTLQQIDFDRIDTVRYNFKYGLQPSEGVDTVSFRTKQPPLGVCTPDGHCF